MNDVRNCDVVAVRRQCVYHLLREGECYQLGTSAAWYVAVVVATAIA